MVFSITARFRTAASIRFGVFAIFFRARLVGSCFYKTFRPSGAKAFSSALSPLSYIKVRERRERTVFIGA
jgi:hypothetical protein